MKQKTQFEEKKLWGLSYYVKRPKPQKSKESTEVIKERKSMKTSVFGGGNEKSI